MASPAEPAEAPGGGGTVKTFMLAVATDHGPRLMAFRVSNLLIGRLPDNHLALNHTSVSRRHAKISVSTRGPVIEDMGSQNGTTLNGQPLKGVSPLKPGDIVRIGHVPLYYFGFINPAQPPTAEVIDGSILVNPIVPTVN